MSDFTAQAERAASAILAEHGEPQTRTGLHSLLAYAYAQGARDETAHVVDVIEDHKQRTLEVLGGATEPFDPNAPRTYDVSGGEFKPVQS